MNEAQMIASQLLNAIGARAYAIKAGYEAGARIWGAEVSRLTKAMYAAMERPRGALEDSFRMAA